MKSFSDVHHDGNVLILTISYLTLIMSFALILNLNIQHIQSIQQIDHPFEIIQLKAINRAKHDFYNQKYDEFTIKYLDYMASGSYDMNVCTIEIKGKKEVKMIINYDDVFLCIESIEFET